MDAEVFAALQLIFAEVFGRDDIVIDPGLTSGDLVGWDSFRQVEINLALEERFGIRIRTRDMHDIANLGDLAALVARKRDALAT